MKNSKKIILISIFTLIGLLTSNIFAQESNRPNLKNKIKNIIGHPSQIIIETDEGKYIFNQNESEEILRILKSKSHKILIEEDVDTIIIKKLQGNQIFVSDEFEELQEVDIEGKLLKKDAENIEIIYKGKDGKTIEEIIKLKNIDRISDFAWVSQFVENDIEKKVHIEVKDNNKKVTITSTKDGDKSIEVLEGIEAEEFLKKFEEEHRITIYKDKSNKNKELIWLEEEIDANGDTIKKKIKIDIKGKTKKVIITTTENDGNVTNEVLEGEEAEKYLNKLNKGKGLYFVGKDDDTLIEVYKIKVDEDGNTIKIVIDEDDNKIIKKKIKVKKEK